MFHTGTSCQNSQLGCPGLYYTIPNNLFYQIANHRVIVAQTVVGTQEEMLKFWQSSKNDISWTAITFEGNPSRGNLVNWKGRPISQEIFTKKRYLK